MDETLVEPDADLERRHRAAVLAPLNRLRDLGGNWHAAAALLEQSMHALFAGQPPEPMVETPHEDGPVTPQPANLAYRPQPANLAYRPQPANLAYRPELGGVAGPAGDPTPP